MPNTHSTHLCPIGTSIVTAGNPSTVSSAQSSPLGKARASLVAAPLDIGSVADANAPLLDLVGASLRIADLIGDFRTVSFAHSSLLGEFRTAVLATEWLLGAVADADSALDDSICTPFGLADVAIDLSFFVVGLIRGIECWH